MLKVLPCPVLPKATRPGVLVLSHPCWFTIVLLMDKSQDLIVCLGVRQPVTIYGTTVQMRNISRHPILVMFSLDAIGELVPGILSCFQADPAECVIINDLPPP
jgi:hypothetical protein